MTWSYHQITQAGLFQHGSDSVKLGLGGWTYGSPEKNQTLQRWCKLLKIIENQHAALTAQNESKIGQDYILNLDKMKSGCSVCNANFLWSAVLQHLKRWRRSMNQLLQCMCDGNWTFLTLKKKKSGNIWKPRSAVTHLLCARTPAISWSWFEGSCGFRFQPSDSSSWLLTFTSSSLSMSVPCPSHVPSSPSFTLPLSICRSALSFGRQHWILPCRVLQLHDSWCIQCDHVPEQGASWTSMQLAKVREETTIVLPS